MISVLLGSGQKSVSACNFESLVTGPSNGQFTQQEVAALCLLTAPLPGTPLPWEAPASGAADLGEGWGPLGSLAALATFY